MTATDDGGATTASGYRAFLSYSHADEAIVRKLHERLETYRVPASLVGTPTAWGPIPKRIAPVFRDRDELSSGADLGEHIRRALQASLCLVVVASPSSARSRWVDQEVRTFKALGRADRVFAIIVDGEPNGSDRPGLEAQECFCPALRFTVDRAGALTSTRAEPLAADARKAGDGFDDALLKLIAGLLGVGFDRLKQRERSRQRRQRRAKATLGVVAGGALALGYAALADFDVAVPQAPSIRSGIDHWGLSVFRPIAPPQVVASELISSRDRLRDRLEYLVTRPGWFERKSASAWEFGQVAAALARNPGASASDIALAAGELVAALEVTPPRRLGQGWFGWPEPDGVVRAESSLWMLMGLAAVMPRSGALSEATRQNLSKLLTIAQDAADLCHPGGDGGWNDVPQREDGAEHYVYTTAVALHALVDLRESGLCWRGDCGRLETMITDTAGWLVSVFVDDHDVRGWRVENGDDRAPNGDLSVLALGALGRAALAAHVAIPMPIRNFAYAHLASLNARPYQPSSEGVYRFSKFHDADGGERQTTSAARLFWLPWSFEAAVAWSRLVERDRAPPEIRRGLARSVGHIAVGLADAMRQEMTAERTLPYVTAETLARLDGAP